MPEELAKYALLKKNCTTHGMFLSKTKVHILDCERVHTRFRKIEETFCFPRENHAWIGEFFGISASTPPLGFVKPRSYLSLSGGG